MDESTQAPLTPLEALREKLLVRAAQLAESETTKDVAEAVAIYERLAAVTVYATSVGEIQNIARINARSEARDVAREVAEAAAEATIRRVLAAAFTPAPSSPG